MLIHSSLASRLNKYHAYTNKINRPCFEIIKVNPTNSSKAEGHRRQQSKRSSQDSDLYAPWPKFIQWAVVEGAAKVCQVVWGRASVHLSSRVYPESFHFFISCEPINNGSGKWGVYFFQNLWNGFVNVIFLVSFLFIHFCS